jgi:hypothetical protein
MRWIPTAEMIRQSWEKYSLIVIGNIVFFLLLYFFSYKPNNDEKRAAEFLSMAQVQETQNHYEAANVLYQKVISDYSSTKSSITAKKRLEYLKGHKTKTVKKQKDVIVQPILDVEKMLSRKPSVYVATFLAKHYGNNPRLKSKIFKAIKKYLWIAVNMEGISLAELKTEPELNTDEFKNRIFKLKPDCISDSGWIYDDFKIKNNNFYPWHNATINLTVVQGNKKENKSIRINYLKPGASEEILSFRVKNSAGPVYCRGTVTAKEGTTQYTIKI